MVYDFGVNARILADIIATQQNDFSGSCNLARKGDLARHLIADAAEARGYKIVHERKLFFRVIGADFFSVFSQNSPDVSVVSRSITINKHLCNAILRDAGLPVPDGQFFSEHSTALDYFLGRNAVRPQVVKPLTGSGAYGVTIEINDAADFAAAWSKARRFGRRILVEDRVDGDEVRIIVLGDQVIAAVCRVPAHVTGDGQSSIEELVSTKNAHRNLNPLLKLYPLKPVDMLDLQGRCPSEVLAAGEHLRLSGPSNISMGGDSVSVIDHLHPSIFQMAKCAANALPGTTLVGLYIMVKNFTASAESGNACILEVNSNPAIATPVFAGFGPPAWRIPNQLIEFIESGQHQTASRLAGLEDNKQAAPAPQYNPSCKGASFARNYSTQIQLLRAAAYERNLIVEAKGSFITIVRDGNYHVGFYQCMPSVTRSVSRRACNNKSWTKSLLAAAKIATPVGKEFSPDEIERAWSFAKKFGSFVVKPFVGSGGAGITVGVSNRKDFEQAWAFACATKAKRVIIESFISGRDYRIMVVGHHIIAVSQRIPAHLVGDGVHSVKQLLKVKNNIRKSNPYHGAKPLALTPPIQQNLARNGLCGDSVLAAGQYLELHAVANIGSGGESHDRTDVIHPGWEDIATRVRQAVYDPFHVGIDLIAEDIGLSPDGQSWAVIEVNANPDLGMHHFPMAGKARDVAGCLMDRLFPSQSEAEFERKAVSMRIFGKVQGVGFRKWLWKQAHARGLSGWVANREDGSLESVLSGPSNAVDDMIEICWSGSRQSVVSDVQIAPFYDEIRKEFVLKKNYL